MHRSTSGIDRLDQQRTIDLATALGVGIEDAVHDGLLAAIEVCGDPRSRQAFRRFLDARGRSLRGAHAWHPDAAAFLVHLGDAAVAAAALLPDARLGLPVPPEFEPPLAGLRRQGRRLALLHPLVPPDGLPARIAGLILRALFRLALLAAKRLDGRTDILAVCPPEYARFFAQVLLFSVEAELPPGEAAPGRVLLRLDLDLCPGEWLRLYGDGAWSPYTLYARPTAQAARIVAWLDEQRRPPAPSEVAAAWFGPGDGPPQADEATRRALLRWYPGLAEHIAEPRRDGTGPAARAATLAESPCVPISALVPRAALRDGRGRRRA